MSRCKTYSTLGPENSPAAMLKIAVPSGKAQTPPLSSVDMELFLSKTATLSQGCSQTGLSSPRAQQGGKGSSLTPHTRWQLLLSPHLLSPNHSAAFLTSSLPSKAPQATQQPTLCSLDKLLLGAVEAVEESWSTASLLNWSAASCVHSASKPP